MKFFNYERLYLLSRGKPELLLRYFKEDTVGYDFIVNESVVDDLFISDQYKAEYIGLCSLRNYEDYYHNKEVNLRIDLIPPWVPMEVIEKNPLIKLTDKKIILKKENKQWQ